MKMKYIHKTFSSDQRMRSVNDQTAQRYTIDLDEAIQNVIGIQLLNASIPRSEYIVDSHNDTIDIETIKWVSTTEFVKRDIQIELKKARRTQTGMLRKLRNAREERLMYVHLIEELDASEHGVLPDGTRLVEAIYDPVKSEQLEQDYWVKRLGKQAAMDMIAYGRIGVGNMDSITMMDKNTQRETLQTASDIAITIRKA